MNLELKIKDIIDIEENPINLGDKVQILKITDDSGHATDLYGVESHLNSWVEIIYIEPFEGIVTFDENKLMIVIKNDRKSLPLSSNIRYNIFNESFHRIQGNEFNNIVNEFKLPDNKYETFIKYLKKIS